MISAIGIAGSPRKNGNSTTLLKSVLKGAEANGARTDVIYLNDFLYKGCQGCKICSPNGRCIVKDPLTPVLSALKMADIWVLASPIYYDGLSGQIKLLFDRCRHLTIKDGKREPQLKGKRRAAFIVTYEDNPSEFYLKVARAQAGYFSWMGNFGEISIVSESNLSEAEAASNRPDLLEKAENIGRRMVEELEHARV